MSAKTRPMPTRNISLTPKQDALIAEQRRAEDALKHLRIAMSQGIAALDRGEYTELADENLDSYLDGLAAPENA